VSVCIYWCFRFSGGHSVGPAGRKEGPEFGLNFSPVPPYRFSETCRLFGQGFRDNTEFDSLVCDTCGQGTRPENGLGSVPAKWMGGSYFSDTSHACQATAVWQWLNYDCAQIPAGKTPLRINLDETAICLYQGEAKGTVFASKRRQRDGGVVQRVGLGKRRCYLTHIALICDRSDVQ
jgi:hypothetical protein